MKFTNKEAYEKLVAKMTEKGETLNLSERTLKRHVETLMKYAANDETELEDFVKNVLPDVKELDGQYRKDHSDFIKNWNDSHPNPTPKDDKKDDNVDNGNKVKDPQLAAILEKMEKMEKRIENEDKAKAISKKKLELNEALEKKGVKDKDWRDAFLSEISITEEMDIDEKAESILKFYNKSMSVTDENLTPAGSRSKTNYEKEFDNIASLRKKRIGDVQEK